MKNICSKSLSSKYETMLIKLKHGFVAKLVIITSSLLLMSSFILGTIMMNNSQTAIKSLIDSRMLDVANSAAAMIDGDVLEKLTERDIGTEPYKKIYDTLAVFQKNIGLRYIYTVRDLGNKQFVFIIDPSEDPGEFGESIVYTDALYSASKGTPCVDKKPYVDRWGRFYSAFSPVFDSQKNIAGIVAVDFSADWIDKQINQQTNIILLNTVLTVLFGILLILIITGNMKKDVKKIMGNISEVSESIEDLLYEINPDKNSNKLENKDKSNESGKIVLDNIKDLGKKVDNVKNELESYIMKIHSRSNRLFSALSPEYKIIFLIDINKDEAICFQPNQKVNDGPKEGERLSFHDAMEYYANNFIVEKYQKDFLRFADPDFIRKSLEKEKTVTFRYMVHENGQNTYEMFNMVNVKQNDSENEDSIKTVGMGFMDVDDEIRNTLNRSNILSNALTASESANKAKTAFLSNMSHEIRTPMNAIIGLNKIALNEPDISENMRDHLEKIGASADHLLKIINEVLDMSRIESGKMVLNHEQISIKKLINQVDIIIRNQCEEKGLNWVFKISDEIDDYYIGDDIKLKQVLVNILGNAIKFTPSGGSVSLTVEQNAKYDKNSILKFVISDTGIGMCKEFIPKIFESFSQEDYSSKSKYGSTGLGMSITKNIVEIMNGDIQVESQKNVGSTFTVTIPLKNLKNNEDKYTEIDSQNLPEQSLEQETANKKDKEEIKGKHILIAEDMDVNAEIIQMILKMREITVERASNGKIAIELFSSNPIGHFDAILMDMRMPEMDGLEATKHIRSLDRDDAKSIPIIALTANAFDEDIQKSLQAGLNAHLSKPVEPEYLFETLENLIKS